MNVAQPLQSLLLGGLHTAQAEAEDIMELSAIKPVLDTMNTSRSCWAQASQALICQSEPWLYPSLRPVHPLLPFCINTTQYCQCPGVHKFATCRDEWFACPSFCSQGSQSLDAAMLRFCCRLGSSGGPGRLE